MSGAVLALAGVGAPGGGSGTPGAVNWSNVSSLAGGSTNTQTLSGVTGSLTISASYTGDSTLGYTLNGASQIYTGAFPWPNGQTLAWYLIGPGAGTVTVSDAAGVLDSFTYSIRDPRTGAFS